MKNNIYSYEQKKSKKLLKLANEQRPKARNGSDLELPGGRYCKEYKDLNNKPKHRDGYVDFGGYICADCGGRISKWVGFYGKKLGDLDKK